MDEVMPRIAAPASETAASKPGWETIAQEYAAALSHLEQLSFDVEEFKIPEAWLYHPVTASDPSGTRYAKYRVVKRSNFVTKLDAVLEYINMIKSE